MNIVLPPELEKAISEEINQNNLQKAKQLYSDYLLRLDDGKTPIRTMLADAWLLERLGKPEEALKILSSAISASGRDAVLRADALLFRASIHAGMEKYRQAADDLAAVSVNKKASDTQRVFAKYHHAQITLTELSDPGLAMKEYNSLLAMYTTPKTIRFASLVDLSVILHERKDFDGALQKLNEAIQMENIDPSLLYVAYSNKGSLLQQQDKMDESVRAYQQAARLDDISVEQKAVATLAQVGIYVSQEKYAEAVNLCHRVLSWDGVPDRELVLALALRGGCLFEEEKHIEAIRDFDEAITRDGQQNLVDDLVPELVLKRSYAYFCLNDTNRYQQMPTGSRSHPLFAKYSGYTQSLRTFLTYNDLQKSFSL